MVEEIIITKEFARCNPGYWKIFQDKKILGITRKTDSYVGYLVEV